MWLVVSESYTKYNFHNKLIVLYGKNQMLFRTTVSKNKLTRNNRICICISVVKRVRYIFHSNKKVISRIEKTGQLIFENVYNYLEARNNDGSNKLNKATYSTELVLKLLNILWN